MSRYAEDFLKKKETHKVTLTEMARGTITGGAIGMLGGGLYAYFNKTPFLKTVMIGTVIGFGISGLFLVKK